MPIYRYYISNIFGLELCSNPSEMDLILITKQPLITPSSSSQRWSCTQYCLGLIVSTSFHRSAKSYEIQVLENEWKDMLETPASVKTIAASMIANKQTKTM